MQLLRAFSVTLFYNSIVGPPCTRSLVYSIIYSSYSICLIFTVCTTPHWSFHHAPPSHTYNIGGTVQPMRHTLNVFIYLTSYTNAYHFTFLIHQWDWKGWLKTLVIKMLLLSFLVFNFFPKNNPQTMKSL